MLTKTPTPCFRGWGGDPPLWPWVFFFGGEGVNSCPSPAPSFEGGGDWTFYLNRHFTFHSEETFWRSAVKFAINVAVCYGIAYALAQPIAGWVLGSTGMDPIWQERLTKLGGMALYTILNYFGQRFFAFQKKKH